MARMDARPASTVPLKYDVILVGAGLANSVLALFLRSKHPNLKILLLEKNHQVSRSKTWCFHETDVNAEQFNILKPALAKSWPGYEVRFPNLNRRIETWYHAIKPENLEKHLVQAFAENLIFEAKVQTVSADHVQLEDGKKIQAACIVDGRGFSANSRKDCGYQKFVGLHVELAQAHHLKIPILMDATVEQLDGYRFFYTLPFSETEILIEDTRYSANPDLQISDYLHEIQVYLQNKNWKLKRLQRVEEGVLPIPLHSLKEIPSSIPRFGTAGGFFHPVTGYSLPSAVALADRISSLAEITSPQVREVLDEERSRQTKHWKYLCLLNRMMFEASRPEERYRIFERFYSLDKDLIGRFYTGNLPLSDKLRLVMGKPPVPISSAVRCLWRPRL